MTWSTQKKTGEIKDQRDEQGKKGWFILTTSIIQANINGAIKRHILSDWVKWTRSNSIMLPEVQFKYKDATRLKVKGWCFEKIKKINKPLARCKIKDWKYKLCQKWETEHKHKFYRYVLKW